MMQHVEPLADIAIDPTIAALPKVDLHVHQEQSPRLDRVLARREGRASYNWQGWSQHLLDEVPPGLARLLAMGEPDIGLPISPEGPEETVIAKLSDLLEEEASDGAVLVEVRVGPGGDGFWRPDFMDLFREAEARVRRQYPRFHAEIISYLSVADDDDRPRWERQFEATLLHAQNGLVGIDFVVSPYDTEADPALWQRAYQWAEQAVDVGLGVTVHAAEFSEANLDAALRTPGLSRLGHAVYATAPRFLEAIAARRITVECCLSCNVVLGAIDSYEAHPIHTFMRNDIPVTLNTDDPVRICTTIGREYAIASLLGLSTDDLLGCTRNAIHASFTTPQRRAALLAGLDA